MKGSAPAWLLVVDHDNYERLVYFWRISAVEEWVNKHGDRGQIYAATSAPPYWRDRGPLRGLAGVPTTNTGGRSER
jgi:hypothetical protein